MTLLSAHTMARIGKDNYNTFGYGQNEPGSNMNVDIVRSFYGNFPEYQYQNIEKDRIHRCVERCELFATSGNDVLSGTVPAILRSLCDSTDLHSQVDVLNKLRTEAIELKNKAHVSTRGSEIALAVSEAGYVARRAIIELVLSPVAHSLYGLLCKALRAVNDAIGKATGKGTKQMHREFGAEFLLALLENTSVSENSYWQELLISEICIWTKGLCFDDPSGDFKLITRVSQTILQHVDFVTHYDHLLLFPLYALYRVVSNAPNQAQVALEDVEAIIGRTSTILDNAANVERGVEDQQQQINILSLTALLWVKSAIIDGFDAVFTETDAKLRALGEDAVGSRALVFAACTLFSSKAGEQIPSTTLRTVKRVLKTTVHEYFENQYAEESWRWPQMISVAYLRYSTTTVDVTRAVFSVYPESEELDLIRRLAISMANHVVCTEQQHCVLALISALAKALQRLHSGVIDVAWKTHPFQLDLLVSLLDGHGSATTRAVKYKGVVKILEHEEISILFKTQGKNGIDPLARIFEQLQRDRGDGRPTVIYKQLVRAYELGRLRRDYCQQLVEHVRHAISADMQDCNLLLPKGDHSMLRDLVQVLDPSESDYDVCILLYILCNAKGLALERAWTSFEEVDFDLVIWGIIAKRKLVYMYPLVIKLICGPVDAHFGEHLRGSMQRLIAFFDFLLCEDIDRDLLSAIRDSTGAAMASKDTENRGEWAEYLIRECKYALRPSVAPGPGDLLGGCLVDLMQVTSTCQMVCKKFSNDLVIISRLLPTTHNSVLSPLPRMLLESSVISAGLLMEQYLNDINDRLEFMSVESFSDVLAHSSGVVDLIARLEGPLLVFDTASRRFKSTSSADSAGLVTSIDSVLQSMPTQLSEGIFTELVALNICLRQLPGRCLLALDQDSFDGLINLLLNDELGLLPLLQSDTPESANIGDDGNEDIDADDGSYRPMMIAWRVVEQKALILTDVAASSAVAKVTNYDYRALVRRSMKDFFVNILETCRHVGVVEIAGRAFAKFVQGLSDERFGPEHLAFLADLRQEVAGHLVDIITAKTVRAEYLDRRSIGLCHVLKCTLLLHKDGPAEDILRPFVDIHCHRTGHDTARVVVNHLLRYILRDSDVSHLLMPFMDDVLNQVFKNCSHPNWRVRNSNNLVFSACITRIFNIGASIHQNMLRAIENAQQHEFDHIQMILPNTMNSIQRMAEIHIESGENSIWAVESMPIASLLCNLTLTSNSNSPGTQQSLQVLKLFLLDFLDCPFQKVRSMCAFCIGVCFTETQLEMLVNILVQYDGHLNGNIAESFAMLIVFLARRFDTLLSPAKKSSIQNCISLLGRRLKYQQSGGVSSLVKLTILRQAWRSSHSTALDSLSEWLWEGLDGESIGIALARISHEISPEVTRKVVKRLLQDFNGLELVKTLSLHCEHSGFYALLALCWEEIYIADTEGKSQTNTLVDVLLRPCGRRLWCACLIGLTQLMKDRPSAETGIGTEQLDAIHTRVCQYVGEQDDDTVRECCVHFLISLVTDKSSVCCPDFMTSPDGRVKGTVDHFLCISCLALDSCPQIRAPASKWLESRSSNSSANPYQLIRLVWSEMFQSPFVDAMKSLLDNPLDKNYSDRLRFTTENRVGEALNLNQAVFSVLTSESLADGRKNVWSLTLGYISHKLDTWTLQFDSRLARPLTAAGLSIKPSNTYVDPVRVARLEDHLRIPILEFIRDTLCTDIQLDTHALEEHLSGWKHDLATVDPFLNSLEYYRKTAVVQALQNFLGEQQSVEVDISTLTGSRKC